MRKSTLNLIIAFVLVVVLTIGVTITCAIGSSGFTNSNFLTWFNSWGKGKEDSPAENLDSSDSSSNVVITPGESNIGIQLCSTPLKSIGADGLEQVVPDSFVIKASSNLQGKEFNTFTWAYAFENNSSLWAGGKNVNDYESFNVSSDTTELTVSAKQAFGEPIIITVTSTLNKDAVAPCKIDYIKRISSVTFDVNKSGLHMFILGEENTFEIIPTYTVGTVTGDCAINKVHVSLNRAVEDVMIAALGSGYGHFQFCAYDFAPTDSLYPFDFINTPSGGGNSAEARLNNNCKIAYNAMLQCSSSAPENANGHYLNFKVDYIYSFNGCEISTGTSDSKEIAFNKGSLVPYEVVTSVTLNSTHIYQ